MLPKVDDMDFLKRHVFIRIPGLGPERSAKLTLYVLEKWQGSLDPTQAAKRT